MHAFLEQMKTPSCIISFVTFLCLSIRMEKRGYHWTDSYEIWYYSIFRKFLDNIKIWLKSEKNFENFSTEIKFD